MKKTAWMIFGLLACAGMAVAADNDLAARLAAPQARVRFAQCDLADALSITGESAHANVLADWAALQAAGIKQPTQVSMDFDNVSAATTLDVICRLIGKGANWYIDDGIVRVTTQEQIDKHGATKAYWLAGRIGMPSDPAPKMADMLRNYMPGLSEDSIHISEGHLLVRGSADTQQRVEQALELCTRPMTLSEWRQLLGVEKDLDDSRDLISVSWRGVPLGQCLGELSVKAKIPMVLDSSADPSQAITLEMREVKPRQILDELLQMAASQNTKPDDWTCEPMARGQVMWVGPMSKAGSWCASYLLGPAAMRDLRINSPMEAAPAICAGVAGCDPEHISWMGGMHILCLQKMDQIIAIGKLLGDPSFEAAMRPAAVVHNAGADH